MANDNKQLTRRLMEEVWNNGKLLLLDELLDPAFEGRDPLAELRNGKVLSEYSEWDLAALLRQLDLESVTVPLAVRRPLQQQRAF